MSSVSVKSTAKKSSKKARATAARLAAVQAIYQQIENDQSAASVVGEYMDHRFGRPVDGEEMIVPDGALFRMIVKGVEERRDDLSHVIATNMKRPEAHMKGVDPLLQAIFLCGGYELLAHHEIDGPIIISDYLHVTHAFYDQGESKLVNAILDRLQKAFRDA